MQRPVARSLRVTVCALLIAAALHHAAALRWRSPVPTGSPATSQYTAAAEADRVTALPGAPPLDFGLFSGYITVDEDAGRALHYVFAEAKAAASEAPVVLWLNGGPGCSSLGGGFMAELGPFYPRQDGRTLQPNPYSWNTLANMLWLESPAFVGFSYSNTSSDAIVGDARTAADSRAFLLGWLKRFPQYAAADLYLSGESYAGHYVPQLAMEIWRGNQQAAAAAAAAGADSAFASGAAAANSAGGAGASKGAAGAASQQQQEPASTQLGAAEGHINIKGLLVGNAWTDPAIDNRGALDFWYTHAMVSAEAAQGIADTCDFRTIGPLMRGAEAVTLPNTHSSSGAAAATGGGVGGGVGASQGAAQHAAAAGGGVGLAGAAQHAAHSTAQGGGSSSRTGSKRTCDDYLQQGMADLGNINIYEIYADVCLKPAPAAAALQLGVGGGGNQHRAATTTGSGNSSSSSQGVRCKYHGALLGTSCTPVPAAAAPPPPPANPQHLGGRGEGAAGQLRGWLEVARGWSTGCHQQQHHQQQQQQEEEVGRPGRVPRYDPCLDNEVEVYLNLPEVQAALHVNTSGSLPGPWQDCTSAILYSREDLLTSVLPTWHHLLQTDLKLWVYSGDVDGIVPVLGTRRWVEGLQLQVASPWTTWTSSSGQVGGWLIQYQGLTLATVRNAGHMVPYVQPERAYHLLGLFLYGEDALQKQQQHQGRAGQEL